MRITLAHPITVGDILELDAAKSATNKSNLIYGIATDSREVCKGDLFIAFRGESLDGHKYIDKAIGNKASAILCEYCDIMDTDASIILCDNTQKALGMLAKGYHARYKKTTVAITGSVGKTTTKEFVAAVLSEKFRVHKSEGNHNNEIGMPMTLLATPADIEVCVVEMGMDARGDIEYLSQIARPDIAVVTMIGSSHLEHLGTRENICRGKMEIVSGMEKGAPIIVNGNEPLLRAEEYKKYSPIFASLAGNGEYCAQNISVGESRTEFELIANGESHKMAIPAIGAHLVWGALYASVVGLRLGMSIKEIRQGLLNFKSAKRRQDVYTLGGITVMDDCYNAAPESMRAAADVLSILGKKKGARTVAMLGDMLELGEGSDGHHRAIGEYMVKSGISLLFTLGKNAKGYVEGARAAGLDDSCIFSVDSEREYEKCAQLILENLKKGDILLVKASFGIRADRVIKYISEHINI